MDGAEDGPARFMRSLDEVERRLPSVPLAAAVVAYAGDDQAVAGDAEIVFLGDGIAERLQFFAAELDELIADLTVEVVVLRVTVVVFVDGPAAEGHFAE